MKSFRTISALQQFNRIAAGDFSFIWYGDAATLYQSSFTFTMPHQWRRRGRGVTGDMF